MTIIDEAWQPLANGASIGSAFSSAILSSVEIYSAAAHHGSSFYMPVLHVMSCDTLTL